MGVFLEKPSNVGSLKLFKVEMSDTVLWITAENERDAWERAEECEDTYGDVNDVYEVAPSTPMKWVFDDGGRSKYFTATNVGDCVTRAITIATGKDYKEVYDEIQRRSKEETPKQLKKHRRGKRSNARSGVFKDTYKPYLENELGWVWHPTMEIGTGCTTHLTSDELPKGTLIVRVSRHLTCVKDGVIYDTYDCSRGGTRCVYGYWTPPPAPAPVAKRKPVGGLTHEERERLAEAFDIVREVFSDVRDRRGCSRDAKRLDVVLNRLEPMVFHLD